MVIKSYAEEYQGADEQRRAELFAEVCERLHFATMAASSAHQTVCLQQQVIAQCKEENGYLRIALADQQTAAALLHDQLVYRGAEYQPGGVAAVVGNFFEVG